jgi:hypothetical protein
MADFQLSVFTGIIFALLGGGFGVMMAYSGNFEGAILTLYISSGVAAIIILWGYSGVIDEINENSKKITELMEYLTDQLNDEEAEDTSEGQEA